MEFLETNLPVSKYATINGIIRELFIRQVYSIFRKSIYSSKVEKKYSEKYKLILEYCNLVGKIASFSDTLKAIYLVIKTLNFCEGKMGWSIELAYALSGYSVLLASIAKFDKAIVFSNKAIAMSMELKNDLNLAYQYQNAGYIYHWMGEYKKSSDYYKKSFDQFTKLGIIKERNFTLNGMILQEYLVGNYQNMKNYIDKYSEYAYNSNDTYCLNTLVVYEIEYTRAIGNYDEAERIGLKYINEIEKSDDMFGIFNINKEMGITYLYKELFQESIMYFEKAKKIEKSHNFLRQYSSIIHTHVAEAYILKYLKTESNLALREKKIFLNRIKKACKYAIIVTKKWIITYSYTLKVLAKYYQLCDRINDTENTYTKAIQLLKKINFRLELGKTYLDYGMFLTKLNRLNESNRHIQKAYEIFKSIGSKEYIKLCSNLLGEKIDEEIKSTERFSNNIRASQRLTSILSLNQQLSSILNLELLLQKILEITIESTGAQNGYIMMLDDDMVVSNNGILTKNELTKVSLTIINKVIEKGETIISQNAAEDLELNLFDSVITNSLKSVLCIPINFNDEIKGVCYLDNLITTGVFDNEDADIINMFMTQAVISIENSKLFKLSITDGLTDLLTHKHFKSMLDRDISIAKRYKKSLSLIMFDIDFFKKFNDTYGHQAGDEVLIKVSQITKYIFRNIDVVARYGGEEFAILLPETDLKEAYNSAERLRKAIEDLDVTYHENILKVTISIGIACYPFNAQTSDSLINSADKALYESKKNGRNRIEIYSNKNVFSNI